MDESKRKGATEMIILLLVLVFLFAGEPDLWDNLHDWAMRSTSPNTTNVTIVNGDCKK